MTIKRSRKYFNFQHHLYTTNQHFNNTGGLAFNYLDRLREGRAKLIYGKNCLHFQKGDIFFIPVGIPYHSYWICENGKPVCLDSIGFSILPNMDEVSYSIQKLELPEEYITMLDEITKTYEISCRNLSLLYSIFDYLEGKMEIQTTDKYELIVTMARSFMHNNDEYSIADVAKYCNVSETVVYSAFRKVCGYTPIEEKQKIMMKNAVNLLETTDLPIEEIIARSGYFSPSYFRKIFYKHIGKTPRQVRKDAKMM